MNTVTLFDNFFDTVLPGTFPEFTVKGAYTVPKVDVRESKDAYVLEMDLPGRTEKDVHIELNHNVLDISSYQNETNEDSSAEKKTSGEDSETWLIRERCVNEFNRRFTLPEDANGENVSAVFKNGVLSVTIPRKAFAAPKKIAIEAA